MPFFKLISAVNLLSKRTCALTFWCQQLGLLHAVQFAAAATATFRNQCNFEVNVYDNNSTCQISAGETAPQLSDASASLPKVQCTVTASALKPPVSFSKSDFLVLMIVFGVVAEFSYGDNKVWYDISTVPPGSIDCDSYESCTEKTGKAGFNIGVMIAPVSLDDDANFACNSLLCQYAECPDAFRFLSDEIKVRNCPEQQHFNITFCP